MVRSFSGALFQRLGWTKLRLGLFLPYQYDREKLNDLVHFSFSFLAALQSTSILRWGHVWCASESRFVLRW